ncbi:spore coat associated protein CotJA [Brevibacillus sp. SYP-B805]|uniref:spore coat associated protein CotJA n=1 Tax=Brevibacillus sp. SYP-B805 TaxID=1578199 RepID=UPI0013EBF819|nr:spore coat associated protein CotJA [Brevibacillus sp. SYP-B805]NGQ94913.1 spore coat associated protein CotJA [Brevibacillus sp. SYP-B805]
MDSQWRFYKPYVSPFDPCRPQTVKRYVVAPNQFLVFQPPNLPQFPPMKALRKGTLWPALFSPYDGQGEQRAGDSCE